MGVALLALEEREVNLVLHVEQLLTYEAQQAKLVVLDAAFARVDQSPRPQVAYRAFVMLRVEVHINWVTYWRRPRVVLLLPLRSLHCYMFYYYIFPINYNS